MKYFKFKFLAFLSLILIFSSCSNDDGLETLTINNIELHNNNLINSYVLPVKKNSNTAEHFSSHFDNYQFYINNEVVTLGEILDENDISSIDFYNLYVEKVINFQIKSLAKNGNDGCEESCEVEGPTEAEIFEAMMAECENYFLLYWPCRASVEIAYILR